MNHLPYSFLYDAESSRACFIAGDRPCGLLVDTSRMLPSSRAGYDTARYLRFVQDAISAEVEAGAAPVESFSSDDADQVIGNHFRKLDQAEKLASMTKAGDFLDTFGPWLKHGQALAFALALRAIERHHQLHEGGAADHVAMVLEDMQVSRHRGEDVTIRDFNGPDLDRLVQRCLETPPDAALIRAASDNSERIPSSTDTDTLDKLNSWLAWESVSAHDLIAAVPYADADADMPFLVEYFRKVGGGVQSPDPFACASATLRKAQLTESAEQATFQLKGANKGVTGSHSRLLERMERKRVFYDALPPEIQVAIKSMGDLTWEDDSDMPLPSADSSAGKAKTA